VSTKAPTAYEIALQRLDRVEAERWPSRNHVATHYDEIAQVLRQYLEEAHEVGALERTTSELLWAIPPYLGRRGLRDACQELFEEADLVKFAEVRPTEDAARDFLSRARQLLNAWNEIAVPDESGHAIR
jgi:hypothetical protein